MLVDTLYHQKRGKTMTRNCESCGIYKLRYCNGSDKASCTNWHPSLEAYEKLELDFEKLKTCVEFYADGENWYSKGQMSDDKRIIDNCDGEKFSSIIFGGKLARQALTELEGL